MSFLQKNVRKTAVRSILDVYIDKDPISYVNLNKYHDVELVLDGSQLIIHLRISTNCSNHQHLFAPGYLGPTVKNEKHSNGISPLSIGNTSSKGPFSIAMLVYRSVNL